MKSDTAMPISVEVPASKKLPCGGANCCILPIIKPLLSAINGKRTMEAAMSNQALEINITQQAVTDVQSIKIVQVCSSNLALILSKPTWTGKAAKIGMKTPSPVLDSLHLYSVCKICEIPASIPANETFRNIWSPMQRKV
jgi:hypothetical protein